MNGDVTPLADDVDLLVAPVWSPDSASIVVRKNTPATDAAGSFELLLLGRDGSRATLTTWTTAAVFPIAFAPDGSKLYFATLNNAGTDLYSIAPDGTAETKIAHLSDQIARDWRLSPDGSALAYSVAESGSAPVRDRETLDLTTGAASDAIGAGRPAGGPAEHRHRARRAQPGVARQRRTDDRIAEPRWRRQRGRPSMPPAARRPSRRTTTASTSRSTGRPTARRSPCAPVDGKTPSEASASHVELVRDGERDRVSESADVQIVGWLP